MEDKKSNHKLLYHLTTRVPPDYPVFWNDYSPQKANYIAVENQLKQKNKSAFTAVTDTLLGGL